MAARRAHHRSESAALRSSFGLLPARWRIEVKVARVRTHRVAVTIIERVTTARKYANTSLVHRTPDAEFANALRATRTDYRPFVTCFTRSSSRNKSYAMLLLRARGVECASRRQLECQGHHRRGTRRPPGVQRNFRGWRERARARAGVATFRRAFAYDLKQTLATADVRFITIEGIRTIRLYAVPRLSLTLSLSLLLLLFLSALPTRRTSPQRKTLART